MKKPIPVESASALIDEKIKELGTSVLSPIVSPLLAVNPTRVR
ncbi:MAG TPA: hypothetical protein VK738_00675 [Terriglobales bacterium]|jgi:hypothetical protein|nr:hypothetical protein [Terriglobales bacterium]